MAKRFLFLPLFSFLSVSSFGQIAHDFLVGGGLDLIKTDNRSIASKAQIAMEGNYFLTRTITASGGLEIWTDDKVSVALGGRWFPVEEAFVRIRGLIGENDLSIGGGWTRPIINEHWKFETMGDFYFRGDFSIRAGVMYIIRR
ncbi:MAG TPA: hypothetical protein VIN08_27405 [Ohtaekwangia sp.]|uniref:hypothetical protein n=1 Tax=Ohtaekwangia sp. TaxID=2066019 RepID=UPI002F927F15